MNKFDSIIGYGTIKKTLMRFSDILKDPAHYKKLGVKTPRGLLLEGAPGVGKTLMASVLIAESGRRAFICRKSLPKGEFINEITETFEKAKQNAPSIVFLDDMDKFANEDRQNRNAEEYVTVQSCIDDVADCEVFVIATVNDIDSLPDSLLRTGRFDDRIFVKNPRGKEAEKIIAHYLKDKPLADDIDISAITGMLDGHSCAELETVMNEAGIIAGYNRQELITMDNIYAAFLPGYGDKDTGDPSSKKAVAYHEAGHAVISELIKPASVSLVYIYRNGNNYHGLERNNAIDSQSDFRSMTHEIMRSLGGLCATEKVFGKRDTGCTLDMKNAYYIAKDMVERFNSAGVIFSAPTHHEMSDNKRYSLELMIGKTLEDIRAKVSSLLSDNYKFLCDIAEALYKKNVLTAKDILKIKNGQ